MKRPPPPRRTRSAARRRRATGGVTFSTLRRLALALPEVEEGSSYGTLAFRVRGKFFARVREDGESVVVRTDLVERDMLLHADPAKRRKVARGGGERRAERRTAAR